MSGTPVRVLHLLRALRVGGLEHVVVDLVNGLTAHGVACHVGCLIEAGEWMGRVRAAGTWVGELERRGRWRTLRDLCRYVRRQRIALLHSHNAQAHYYAVAARLFTGVPVVHTKHGQNWPDDPRWVWKSRQLSRLTRIVVPVSQDIARIVTDVERVPARKVVLIRNGIQVDVGSRKSEAATDGAERAALRARLGLPAGAFIVGSVGRLAWEKHYELLVRAFAAFRRGAPEAVLVLVGEGPYRARIERAAAEAGVAEACRWPGRRADVADWLRAFDLFCLSSLTEGTSITLLEAGAAGLPAVVTDVGGNAEIVPDGVSGVVVPPRDEAALAAAFAALRADPARRAALGAAARARVAAEYAAARMVREYARVYAAVLGTAVPGSEEP